MQETQRLTSDYGVLRPRLNDGMLNNRAEQVPNSQHIQLSVILHSIS